MKFIHSADGSLTLRVEDTIDWVMMRYLIIDLGYEDEYDNEGHLISASEKVVAKFVDCMDEESLWDDIVAPELESSFRADCDLVTSSISTAYESINFESDEDDETADITIPEDQVDSWYSALNQARLVLESRYGLSQAELLLDVSQREGEGADASSFPSNTVFALQRNHLYSSLQSHLLQYMCV